MYENRSLCSNVPQIGIALSESVTKCSFGDEALILVPVWDMDDAENYKPADPELRDHNRSKALKNIQYFFKMCCMEGAQINYMEVGNLCIDATVLHAVGHEGTRLVTMEDVLLNRDKFARRFRCQSAVPKGWTLDTSKLGWEPPSEMLALWEKGIEHVRNDPEYGERDLIGEM